MKLIAKSIVIGVIATGLFFCFLMMFAIPVTAMLARMSSSPQMSDVVVNPTGFLRQFGLPMSGVVFLTAFAVSLRQSRTELQKRQGAGRSRQVAKRGARDLP